MRGVDLAAHVGVEAVRQIVHWGTHRSSCPQFVCPAQHCDCPPAPTCPDLVCRAPVCDASALDSASGPGVGPFSVEVLFALFWVILIFVASGAYWIGRRGSPLFVRTGAAASAQAADGGRPTVVNSRRRHGAGVVVYDDVDPR